MDHLDLPRHPKYPPTIIPYLTTQAYDGKEFESYHVRHGWNDADVDGSAACSKSLDERATFVQTWLFFGLLDCVFGNLYSRSDWIQIQDSGPPAVSLLKLSSKLHQLYPGRHVDDSHNVELDTERSVFMDHDQPSNDTSMHLKRELYDLDIPALLLTAHEMNLRILANGPYNHDLDLICLSVAALGEVLSTHLGVSDDNLWLMSTSNNFLFQRMLDDGWCPLEIIRLTKTSSVAQVYYMSNMDRPGPTRSHELCREQIKLEDVDVQGLFSRSSEDLLRCTAYDMDWQTYKTEHVGDCTCNELYAKQSELEEILEKGFFPVLIPASSIESDEAYLPLASTEDYPKYVCVSHVWSDGLGNPHANALPRCQYLRLSALINDLFPNEVVPFWIDTIGVPREPAKIRRRTIMLMRKTYWDAHVVLVLDKYLLDFDQNLSPESELWLRVTNCGWTRRLWTLQESALAEKVLIQVKGGVIDLDRCVEFKSTDNHKFVVEWIRLRGAWERYTGSSKSETDSQSSADSLLSTLSDALAWRSTSIVEDEAICLAALTNLSPFSIEQILLLESHEDRMMKFWSMQKHLSSNLLFWGGPRIQKSPFKWAPLTFLNQGPTPFLPDGTSDSSPATFCTNRGLIFRLPGMFLGTWNAQFRPRVFLALSSSWYALSSDMDRIPCPSEDDRAMLAVILQQPLSAMDTLPPGSAMGALIVSVQRTNPELFQSLTVTPVSLATIEDASRLTGWVNPLQALRSRANTEFSKVGKWMARKKELNGADLGHTNSDSDTRSDITIVGQNSQTKMYLQGRHMMFEVESTPEEQEWCIG